MKKILIKTAIGLALLISGIQVIYFYIQGLDEGASFILFILALFLIALGFYILLKAGKSDESVFKRLKNIGKKNVGLDKTLEETIEQNNAVSNKWAKTIEKRDKLKMLEVSTAAAAESNNL